jgi:TfoX/Sxy family transcriptional regulator of competence genes
MKGGFASLSHRQVRGRVLSNIGTLQTLEETPMAYDEKLAKRIEAILEDTEGIATKKMFGGLCFLHNGNMVCGVTPNDMMVRVGKERYDDILKSRYARQMDFTGKPLAGMVYVSTEGCKSKSALKKWIDLGLEFTGTLPAK